MKEGNEEIYPHDYFVPGLIPDTMLIMHDGYIPDGQYLCLVRSGDTQYCILERFAGCWVLEEFREPDLITVLYFARLPTP